MTKLDGFTDFGEAVRYEREQHQQVELGYDPGHDANGFHTDGQLAMAGCYMAWPAPDPHLFPHDWDPEEHSFRHGKTRQEMLVVAAALLWAEFDRLNAREE